jgi:hypothetical protein
MSQKSSAPPTRVPAKKLLRDIRRATRKHHSAEDKVRIVLEGLRGEENVAALCRRDPRAQPIRTFAAQGARLVTAHLAGRQRPGLALPLAPFGDAGWTDTQCSSDRPDRLASLGTLNGTLTQIFRIGAHPCWPPQTSIELESENNPIREFRFNEQAAGSRADRVQMESSERAKMLEKQRRRAGCINPCERNTL